MMQETQRVAQTEQLGRPDDGAQSLATIIGDDDADFAASVPHQRCLQSSCCSSAEFHSPAVLALSSQMALTICSTRQKREVKEVRWTITDFPLADVEAGEKLISPESFSADGKTQWKLALFPKGQSGDGEEFISVYLFAVKETLEKSLHASFTLRLENSKRKELESRNYQWKFPSDAGHYSYGTSNFTQRAEILSKIARDGILVVYCQLRVSRGESLSVERVAPVRKENCDSWPTLARICKSKPRTKRFIGKLMWRVYDFESYEQGPGEKLVSVKFSPDGQVMWKLFLFPRGISDDVSEFVSVYLVADRNTIDKMNPQETFYKITFRDAEDHEIAARTYQWRCPADNGHTGFGTEDFITRERLIGALNARSERILKVICDLTTRSVAGFPESGLCAMSEEDKKEIIRNGTLIYLTDSNKAAVPICKELLCMSSPVFQAMFSHDTKENQQKIIELPFCSQSVLRGLAEYLERGETRFIARVPEELLLLADCYDIGPLKRACETELMRRCSSRNMYRLAVLADRTNSRVLSDYASNLIASKLKRTTSKQWRRFVTENGELSQRILEKRATDVHFVDWFAQIV